MRSGSVALPEHRALWVVNSCQEVEQGARRPARKHGRRSRQCQLPLRTKRTPTHSEGSPGVMVTKTPSRWACRRLELCTVRHQRRSEQRLVATYNSTSSC